MAANYKKLKFKDGTTKDEHRYIMERRLGRILSRYEVVHHKNGNKFDNNIENLEIIPLSEHSRIHQTRYMEDHPVPDERRKELSEQMTGQPNYNCAKLTNEQVEKIKQLHSQGLSSRRLGTFFRVAHSTISRVLSDKVLAYKKQNNQ